METDLKLSFDVAYIKFGSLFKELRGENMKFLKNGLIKFNWPLLSFFSVFAFVT